ncbi:hypothetical protein [Streptomyces mirabilis]|uniref:hypothetical protein n=1 Tax=Streptomyces mirabilis TaxID=68239 RepID=UPI00333219E9
MALVTWATVGPLVDALISICIFKSSWFSSDIWDLVPSLEDTFVFAGCWAAVCDCLVLPATGLTPKDAPGFAAAVCDCLMA